MPLTITVTTFTLVLVTCAVFVIGLAAGYRARVLEDRHVARVTRRDPWGVTPEPRRSRQIAQWNAPKTRARPDSRAVVVPPDA